MSTCLCLLASLAFLLYICLSLCLSRPLSDRVCVCLCVSFPLGLFVCSCLCALLSVSVSASMRPSLSVSVPVSLSVSLCLSLSLPVFVCLYLPLSLSVSVCLCLSVCLSLWLFSVVSGSERETTRQIDTAAAASSCPQTWGVRTASVSETKCFIVSGPTQTPQHVYVHMLAAAALTPVENSDEQTKTKPN